MKSVPGRIVFAALISLYMGSSWPQATASRETPLAYSQVAAANDFFLKARERLSHSDPRTGGTLANAREAISLYEQAVEADPNFALAYVELARAWTRLGYSNPDGASNGEILPPARAALTKAIALNPDLADAHLMLAGLAFNIDYQWETADREYREGLRLQPDNADAHANYAAYLSSMGRFPDAFDQLTKAHALKASASTDFAFARLYYAMRRYDTAVAYCNESLVKQDNLVVRFYLGLIYTAEGQYDKAIPELEKTTAEHNGGALAGLAYAYAMAGRTDEARTLLDRLYAGRESGLVVPYRVAAVYVALGEKTTALEWLQKSYEGHDNWLAQLKVDPVMDPLRAEPQFQELMRKLRLSQRVRSRGLAETSLKFSTDGNDPAGLSHCAQFDLRRYARGARRCV